jgi:hypothetical protein
MNMNISRRAGGFTLGLVLVVGGAFGPGRIGIPISAQQPNPCALLSDDDVKSAAAKTSVEPGVPSAFPSYGYSTCRYAWGTGVSRVTLVVSITEASRQFPGMTPDQIKQRLVGSVKTGTNDAVIPDVGDVAVFTPDSFVYATATAVVKGHVLQVHLEGFAAGQKKDQVAGLLKSAASRL